MLSSVLLVFLAQMPPGAQQEIDRLQRLLAVSSDKAAVTYQLAQTWAVIGDKAEALKWLERAVNLKAGFDVGRDRNFASFKTDTEFARLVRQAREDTPPVLNSVAAFEVPEGDLVPENLAWGGARKRFYFGSMTKGKIVACSPAGVCEPFADGLGTVLGMKVDPQSNVLWATDNADKTAALHAFNLVSRRSTGVYPLPPGRHTLNDLALTRKGTVYVTDTPGAAVYVLAKGSHALTKVPGAFPSANGIALSPDESRLYVSTSRDGITLLKSGNSSPIGHPPEVSLMNIDGLYFYRNSLIAIQNGTMTPRVLRFYLDPAGGRIEKFEILERRNPLFNGVTTGVIVGDNFYFMANIQDDKGAGARFDPLRVLKIHLH